MKTFDIKKNWNAGASSFSRLRRRLLIAWFFALQFHSKLAEALRSVQNSGVGEDPTKAETAMTMLDDFQQSIGKSIYFNPSET